MAKANVTEKKQLTLFETLKNSIEENHPCLASKRGKVPILKTREDDMRGKYPKSQEQRDKISQTLTRRALNGNLHSEESNRKRSLTLKGRVPWNKGLHLTGEDKLHKSLAHKGKTHSAEHNRKVGEAQKGKIIPPELRERWSRSHTGVPLSAEHIKAMRKCIRPTTPELKLEALLSYCCPNEYKYTGNGEVVIGGYNPDFTNCNNQKKVIEVFGDYWHRGESPQDRINKYAVFGFACLVIWEHELSVVVWDREIEVVLLTPLIDKILKFENADTHELLRGA